MKSYILPAMVMALAMVACNGYDKDYDATGVFEATEVIVAANGNGEIVNFDVEDGETLSAGEVVGTIDTVQLHLRKKQLEANIELVKSRYRDVNKQLAPLQQQIATQQREQHRFEQLVQASAANQKQLDDITALLIRLKKDLAAQTETLAKSNQSIDAEVTGLEAQIALIADQISKSVIKSPLAGCGTCQVCRARRICHTKPGTVQSG